MAAKNSLRNRFKSNKQKQGRLFHYLVIFIVGGWLVASVYFFYFSSASSSQPSLNIQHKMGKFEKLESFTNIPNSINSESDQSHDRFSHQINCPPVPSRAYPYEWPIMDVINNWNPDDVNIPGKHFESLCRFDYLTELEKARAYRDHEVPFIVYNVPQMNDTVKKWSKPEYLKRKLGSRKYLTEHSSDNHFMYFSSAGSNRPAGWKPPVENTAMTFSDWMDFAVENKNATRGSHKYYFRVNNKEAAFLNRDLPMLTTEGDVDSLFLVNTKMARGIFCRFGMHGVVAAAHFDGSRNYVAIMGGLRRYMIASPKNCEYLYLYPKSHPSGRHSQVDWSAKDIDETKYPKFSQGKVSEVILGAGDLMYIPSGWIHYVMNLNINWQCNARSGKSKGQVGDLTPCGF